MIKKILKEKSAIFCKINFNLHLHFGQFLMNYLVYMLLLHLFWKLWPWWFERIIVYLCTYNGFDIIFKKPSSIFYWTVFTIYQLVLAPLKNNYSISIVQNELSKTLGKVNFNAISWAITIKLQKSRKFSRNFSRSAYLHDLWLGIWCKIKVWYLRSSK